MLGLQNAWLASPFGPQVTQYQPEKVPKSLVLSLSRAQHWRWSFLPVGGVAILLAVVVLLGELAVAVVAVVEVWNARAVRLLVVVGLTRSSRCSRRRSLRRRRRSGWGGSAAAPMRREELDTELGADPHEVIIGGSILRLHDRRRQRAWASCTWGRRPLQPCGSCCCE